VKRRGYALHPFPCLQTTDSEQVITVEALGRNTSS
jgi:hypothetical protein